MKNNLGGLGGNLGNTHNQVPKRKNHFFTCNNYTEEIIEQFLDGFRRLGAIKWAFQEEIGPECGTPHLQGMVMFPKEHRSTEWDALSKGHWEKLKKFDGVYQLKEKTKKPNGRQWIHGFPKPIKIIDQLYPWQLEAERIATGEPDGRTVHWLWESQGNMGKSQFCKYMVVKHNATVVKGGKLADIMNIIFNTNMDTCNCIIFDIPRGTGGKVSYTSLECILDGLITNTKYETGCKVFNPPNVICLANFPPDDPDKLSKDRWNIVNLREDSSED